MYLQSRTFFSDRSKNFNAIKNIIRIAAVLLAALSLFANADGLLVHAATVHRTITYDANGGSFEGGTAVNLVEYDLTDVTEYSHTANISDAGVQSGNYAANLATKDTVSVPGASSLHVVLKYGTQTTYDCVYIMEGTYTGSVDRFMTAGTTYGDSKCLYKYSGGTTSPRTVTLDIPGDTITFAFCSNASTHYYGYYATVTASATTETSGEYKDPIPASSDDWFSGWNTNADGSGQAITDLSDLASDTTLYAQYEYDQIAGGTFRGITWRVTHAGELILGDGTGQVMEDSNSTAWPWTASGVRENITSIRTNGIITANGSLGLMFNGCSNVTTVDISTLDTSGATDMHSMFQNCTSISALDLSNFNTSNVTDMSRMFEGCTAVSDIDVSSFDTSNVTSMSYMFNNCSALTSLDVSGFDTSNVTRMDSMFYYCRSLTGLDVSGFDTAKVTNMSSMFAYCEVLENVDLRNFDTQHVTMINSTFANADITTWKGIEDLDVSSVQSMESAFAGTKGTTLNLSGWNTANVTSVSNMFQNCKIKNIKANGWDTGKVRAMSSFCTGSEIETFEAKGWNLPGITSTSYIFYNNPRMRYIDLEGWNLENCTNFSSMFENCTALETLALDNWDTSSATNMSNMFRTNRALKNLNVSSFNTSNVTSFSSMFYDCNALKTLDVAGFDTSKATNLSSMFYNCNTLDALDVSGFDTSLVTNMNNIFTGCQLVPTLDLSSWDFSNVSSTNLFSQCTSLTKVGLSPTFVRLRSTSKLPDTHKWVREDGTYGPYTGDQLSSNYTDDMAGIWIIEASDNECVVSFNGNGGMSLLDPIVLTEENSSVTMPDSTYVRRPHYELVSWNTMPDGSGTSYAIAETYTDVAQFGSNVTLYAQWASSNLREYKIQHYKQSSDLSSYNLAETEILYASYGTSVTPETKTYGGFISPQPITATVLEDDSLIIRYDYDRVVCTITFDGNGADSGQMEPQNYVGGISTGINGNRFGKKGSLFKGWNTSQDGTGTSYADKQQITDITGNAVTLYAQWLDNSDNELEPEQGVIYIQAKAGQTIIIPDIPAGTTYTIEEVDIPDGWTLTQERDTEGTIRSNRTFNSYLTNSYAASGEAEIVAHKKLNGRPLLAGEFAFELLENGTVIDSKTNEDLDTEPYIPVENGAMTENPWYQMAPVRFSPLQYTFEDIGTHTYTIREIAGNDSTIIYDPHVETVTVTVSDGGHGILDTEVTYDSDGALFENSLQDGSILISKTIAGSRAGDMDTEFTFTPVLTASDGSPLSGTYNSIYTQNVYHTETVDNTRTVYGHTPNLADDGTMLSDFDVTPPFSNYTYYSEVLSIPGVESMHLSLKYSAQRGTFCIWEGAYNIQTNSNGPAYTAECNPNTAIYAPNYTDYTTLYEEELDITGDTITIAYYSYKLNPPPGEWTNYGVYAALTAGSIETIETNEVRETYTPGTPITLKNGETYEITGLPVDTVYSVTETALPGWEVISSDGSTGTVPSGTRATASFVNAYQAEGEAIITATKHLTGEELGENNTFNFELLDADMNTIQIKANDALGNVVFDAIEYDADDAGKTFHYFVREVPESEEYVFDNTVYPVDVAVTDPGTGTLSAVITYPDGSPVFENYRTHSISIGKQVTGSMGDRTDSFEFTLALTGENLTKHDINALKNGKPVSLTATGGVYTFTLRHDEVMTFTGITPGVGYTITETSANKKNYVTSVDSATTGTVQSSDVNVSFTNKREIVVNTGVNTGSRVIWLILAGLIGTAGTVLIFKKTQNDLTSQY